MPDLINSSLEILHGKFKRLGVAIEEDHEANLLLPLRLPFPASAAGTRASESTSTTPASTAPAGGGFLMFIPNLPVRA